MTGHGELTKETLKSRQVTKKVTPVYDSGKKKMLARIKIKVRSRPRITNTNNIKYYTEKN